MSQYNILFSLGKNAYLEDAPILLEAGALVHNTENKRVHIQLKFKNLSNVRISMVKAELVLMDSVGREIGRTEKQYIDLNASPNESFGDKEPVFLKDDTTRKFSATIKEVCFTDGGIWSAPQNVVFEEMSTPTAITQKLTTQEALDEFKILYCEQARYIPFVYKDVWVCSCGNINKTSQEKCCACNAKFSDMKKADNETLKKNNIYRNATELVKENSSSEIRKGIALFGRISDWKDSTTKLEEAKQKLSVVLQKEKFACEQAAKRKKKNIIIAAASCAAVAVLITSICIGSAISKSNKYQQAQEYMSQQKYSEAMDLLVDLDGYKDAFELYMRAVNMYYGDYKYIVDTDNLTEFVIPDGVTSIGSWAFYDCSSLTSITIPDSVTSIGGGAFAYCSSLTSITIPDSVTSIGGSAFYGCRNLTSITIPDSVTSIDSSAFRYCSSLTSVTIGNGVTSIGDSAFYDCGSLTSVTIPDSVTSIGEYAFCYCSSLTSVTIGNGVTSIGEYAFYNCSSLTSVTIGNGVTCIGERAFAYCSSLTSITIPDSVTSIGDYVFYNCSSLTSVTIGNGVTSIGEYAFYNCSSLTSITIPDSVTSIGERAFRYCSSLTSVYYKGSAMQWARISIGDNNDYLNKAKKYYNS